MMIFFSSPLTSLFLGEEYALLLALIKEVCSDLKRKNKKVHADIWQNALDLDLLLGLLKANQKKEAKKKLLEKLKVH